MSKFFTKKKVVMLVVGAIVAIMFGVLIGSNIVDTMKAKEKVAEKAKIENTIEERKQVAEKIKKAESDNLSEEDTYSDEYKEYLKLSDEEKSKQEVIPRKEKVDYSELKKIKEDQKEDLGKEYVLDEDNNDDDNNDEDNEDNNDNEHKEVLPRYFNLKDKINIVVGDQGGYGLCWDFASVKSVETNIALTQGKNYDFSESHIDYMTCNLMALNYRDENDGGNFAIMKTYNESYNGFVLEEDVPLNVYEDYEYNTFYNIPKEEVYITKYAEFPTFYRYEEMSQEEYEAKFKELQTAVKTHIMNYGSIYASITSPDYGKNHYIKDNEDCKDSRGSHAVSIVGWDDNYSKDNFTSPNGNKPEKDGAYIALNSWGEDWGDNGYFYISYEDFGVHSNMSGVVSINKKSDLINVSELGKDAREFVYDNYGNKIIEMDGEEYLNQEAIGTYIDLSNRNLKDISEFEVLINRASSINLSNNELESIEGLEKYITKGGVYINLSNNNIKDVSCLKDLEIYSLILDENYGVTGYEGLNITDKLSLRNCGVVSFEITERLKDICMLNLSGNKIEDYSTLTNLKNLYYLELNNCELTSLDSLKDVLKLESLDYIDLSYNKLKNISGIEECNIYSIDLSYNTEIEDFEPVRMLKNTCCIGLAGCNIKDAKDILIESITEEDIEKAYEATEYIYEDDTYLGITYVLSDNKGISNLKVLKNASSIILENCDLGDISELKEIKYLRYIYLSHNHNLTGDLTGMKFYEINVNDCGLNNDFDLFNVESVDHLYIYENDIDNVDNFINKVIWTVYMDSYDGEVITENDVYISTNYSNEHEKENIVEIEIPDEEGLNMNIKEYLKLNDIDVFDVRVDGNSIYSMRINVPINEDTTISYKSYNLENTIIRFKVNKELKNSGIEVMYNPYLSRLKNENEIKAENLRVANTYGNGISKETDNFELGSDVYKIPSKIVERDYGIAGKSHIYIAEKHFACVSQDEYSAKYTVGGGLSSNVVEVEYDEDLTPPEDFEGEFPTLTFSSRELYDIAKEYWKNLYVRADDNLLTIELMESREVNDYGIPMYIPRNLLYDIKGLDIMIETDIYILMDEENGLDRIEEEELKNFEGFEHLSRIHIVTPPKEYNEFDLIIPQDKYIIEIEQGVG